MIPAAVWGLRFAFCSVLFGVFCAAAQSQPPDPPPRPPVDAVDAGAVVSGRVQALYSYQVQRDGILWSRMLAEIAVEQVESGSAIEPGDLVHARYWVGRRLSNRARVGQYPVPRRGDIVRVVLDDRPDGGLDVAGRGGFEILRVRSLARPALPDVPDADPLPVAPRPVPLPSGPANQIRGRVVLYDEPQEDVTVDLLAAGGIVSTVTTDELGRFAFDPVPAGAYSVAAQGVVKNKIRQSPITPVTVLAAPAEPTDLIVPLEP